MRSAASAHSWRHPLKTSASKFPFTRWQQGLVSSSASLKTALDCAIRYGPRNGRRRVFPLLLAAGATIPSDTTDAYLCKVRAVGFPAYEKAHRQALATKFAAKAFPRLPTDVAGHVVAFAFHVGYY